MQYRPRHIKVAGQQVMNTNADRRQLISNEIRERIKQLQQMRGTPCPRCHEFMHYAESDDIYHCRHITCLETGLYRYSGEVLIKLPNSGWR